MRLIAKEWMREHRDMSPKEFATVLTSLVKGKSSNEKMMAGMLLDEAKGDQLKFDPWLFDKWLDHMVGWVEVDTLCTGKYFKKQVALNVPEWTKILTDLSRSKNINKRRASLACLVSALGHSDDPRLATVALKNIDRLKKEKEILITKAISWVLRTMVRYHRKVLEDYISENESTLPAIAVRETKIKLLTGKKTGGRLKD